MRTSSPSWVPKQSISFTKVPNWWGSPKPTLNTINIDIKDPSTAPTTVDAFFQKGYDLIGYGGNSSNIPLANVLAVQANSREKPDLLTAAEGPHDVAELQHRLPVHRRPVRR